MCMLGYISLYMCLSMCVCMYVIVFLCESGRVHLCVLLCVFTQPFRLGQDVTRGQFFSGVQLVWIQSFPSPRLVTFIIIMSCRQLGYHWPSLATSPNRSSLLAGPQGCIPYPHIVAVCRFELVVLLLLGHMVGGGP